MMPYLRIDDQFADHPKVLAAGPLAGWLHVCGMVYCARVMTDGFIPAAQVKKLADIESETVLALVERLTTAGLWEPADGGYVIHDYLQHNPSREAIMAERAAREVRKSLYDDPGTVQRVKQRDQDRCRYCGVAVRWHDRRGPLGGTLDHVEPMRGSKSNLVPIYNAEANVVVACRACNARKLRRSPAEAGMVLLPVPPPPGPAPNLSDTDKSDLVPNQTRLVRTPSHPIPPSEGVGGGEEVKDQENTEGEETGIAAPADTLPGRAPTPPPLFLSNDARDEMHAILSRFQDRGYVVDQRFYAKVAELYPRLDVALEALKLADWLKEPKNRRERCTARRVLNWLARAEEERLRRLAEREQAKAPAVGLNGAAPKPYVPLPPPELPKFTPDQEKASDAERERVRRELAQRGVLKAFERIGGGPAP